MDPDKVKDLERLKTLMEGLKPWMDAGTVKLILGDGDMERVSKELVEDFFGEDAVTNDEQACKELIDEACTNGMASGTFVEPTDDFLEKVSKATDGKVNVGADSVRDSIRVCGRCGVQMPEGNRNPALCKDCADKFTERKRTDKKINGVPVVDVQWADGCDPELHEDENGHLVSDNPMYPYWGADAQKKFWTPKKGEDVGVRVTTPDNVAKCIENAGLEDQFDEGVEYIFENKKGDFIRVYDKTGELRECFTDRFEVVTSSEHPKFHMHFVKNRGNPKPEKS